MMSVDIASITTPAPEGSCVLSILSPDSHYLYPDILALEAIPSHLFPTLDHLWRRSVHQGRPVNIYRFREVFVAEEGLVFDKDRRLIDVTKTYHEDIFVERGWKAVEVASETKAFDRLTTGILAKSRGSSNYGHFIVEMLPRAWLARTRLQLTNCPAIIDSTSEALRNVATQALRQAGFGPEEIVATGPSPLFVEELYVVDGLTSHTQYLSPIVAECLDAMTVGISAGKPSKLYVPRSPAVYRDFEHEPKVAKRLVADGFQVAQTGKMSFVEQVAAFKGATTVVGVTGAALTNLIFCSPGTKVFNFSPSGAAEVLFWMIAAARHLKYREIRCAETGPQMGSLPWDRMLSVDPDEVRRIVWDG